MRRKRKSKIVYAFFVSVILLAVLFSCGAADASSPAKQIEKPEDKELVVCTKQLNIFSIPMDTDNIVWEKYCYPSKMQKVSIGYHMLPRAMREEKFLTTSSYAKNFIGVPYKAAGKSPSEGFDCSGFVHFVLKNCGINMEAAGSQDQYACCEILPEGYERPGDLVFFERTGYAGEAGVCSHVGIYLGDGKMIHAGMKGVAVVDITGEYWPEHFMGFGRPRSY